MDQVVHGGPHRTVTQNPPPPPPPYYLPPFFSHLSDFCSLSALAEHIVWLQCWNSEPQRHEGAKRSSRSVFPNLLNLGRKRYRKNDNIKPFEAGGETSLEFFSQKTDCYSCCMDLTQRSDIITLLLGEHIIIMSMIW
ncbi:hypothetical protein P8452_68453 [Trifolium repens]|nr:hypothetical protein P8452_68453 [Trifolium repens]